MGQPTRHDTDPTSANPPNNHGRGVPDVAGNADPDTGYQVFVDGNFFTLDGSAFVADAWNFHIGNDDLTGGPGFCGTAGNVKSHASTRVSSERCLRVFS